MKALQFSVNTPKFIAAKALKPLFGNRLFFKGPVKTTQLVEIPEPTLPSSEWVKIKTQYCGFCGSDLNLMLLHDSRREARVGPDGALITLEEQDRSLWDRKQIEEGLRTLDRAMLLRKAGAYQIQAAIAALHARAGRPADTDWPQIVGPVLAAETAVSEGGVLGVVVAGTDDEHGLDDPFAGVGRANCHARQPWL